MADIRSDAGQPSARRRLACSASMKEPIGLLGWVKAGSPGTPVWSHDGIVCTGESYKQVVKLTFARGASVEDPKKLFNSSLEGNTRRAIDLRQGEKIDEAAFKQLICAAVAANSAARAQRAAKKK